MRYTNERKEFVGMTPLRKQMIEELQLQRNGATLPLTQISDRKDLAHANTRSTTCPCWSDSLVKKRLHAENSSLHAGGDLLDLKRSRYYALDNDADEANPKKNRCGVLQR